MARPSQNSAAAALAHECEIFCRYLIGRSATVFISGKYSEAHVRDPRYSPASSFDRALLRIACISPWLAQWADSYACIAARSSLLRRKLVLLVAILESSSPEHGFDDQIRDTPSATVLLGMAGRGLLFALRLFFGILFLGPVHFVLAITGSAGARR